MKRTSLFISLFALCGIAWGQVTSFLDVPYHSEDSVDQNLLSMDIYVPEGSGTKPIVFYVHGGGWVIGGKNGHSLPVIPGESCHPFRMKTATSAGLKFTTSYCS